MENLEYVLKIWFILKKNKFEELTLAPMEKKLIEKQMLNKNEIKWLNKYHNNVKKNYSNLWTMKKNII